jgi:anti-sigma factor RsiW
MRAELGALLDGEIEADEAETLTRHLAACADCRAERTGLEQLIQEIGRLPRPDASPALRWRLRAHVQDEADVAHRVEAVVTEVQGAHGWERRTSYRSGEALLPIVSSASLPSPAVRWIQWRQETRQGTQLSYVSYLWSDTQRSLR